MMLGLAAGESGSTAGGNPVALLTWLVNMLTTRCTSGFLSASIRVCADKVKLPVFLSRDTGIGMMAISVLAWACTIATAKNDTAMRANFFILNYLCRIF